MEGSCNGNGYYFRSLSIKVYYYMSNLKHGEAIFILLVTYATVAVCSRMAKGYIFLYIILVS